MSDTAERKPLGASLAINLVGAVVPVVVALATLPIYVRHIGDERYGLMALVWVLLGYFGFLDLGLSRASANALARIGAGAPGERARVVVTSLGLNFALAVVGGAILYLAGGYLLNDVMSVPDDLKGEVAAAMPWIACLLPIALLNGVGLGVIESRERFLVANVLQVSGLAVAQIVPVVVAVFVSPSLAVVVPAAAIARGMSVLAVLAAVAHLERPLRLSDFDRASARQLMGYGGWVTVSGVLLPFLNSLDQFVIGRVLSVASVTYYAVPMTLVARSQLITNALARTLFPRLSSLPVREATAVAGRALVAGAILYGGFCAVGLILFRPLLTLWMGADFAASAGGIGVFLLAGVLPNALTFAPYTLLQAQGRPDLTAKFHMAQMLPYALVLFVLVREFGLMGAAAAYLLRNLFDFGLLVVISPMKNRILLSLLPSAGLILFACLCEVLFERSLTWLLVSAIVVALGSLILLRLQERQTFDDIVAMVRHVFGGSWRGTRRQAAAEVLTPGE
ncbi:oligosaccharide flippase family protein [Rhizobium sp. TRM95111]|uniref:oligosaccharide flippase family protein n=1 Tax=Rhizobium alarense TaxID=2846851 RepID=UPI001F36878C|nr:oligosaccharide flippase family protein [Rhizobium alarense]MCF3641763.1 oligosaccharide flippase family protein [Rhizobium alarense]